jgi:hypothetical protein
MPAGCGRTDFQGGSAETLFDSVRQRLFTLPPETTVKTIFCDAILYKKRHHFAKTGSGQTYVRKALTRRGVFVQVAPAHDYKGRNLSSIGAEVQYNGRLGSGARKKTPSWSHCRTLKTITLPRQARDKHTKSSGERGACCCRHGDTCGVCGADGGAGAGVSEEAGRGGAGQHDVRGVTTLPATYVTTGRWPSHRYLCSA